MAINEYLKWMAENTPTQWCNDSARLIDLNAALDTGAVGCTTNPPLSYDTLKNTPDDFKAEVSTIDSSLKCNDRNVALVGAVVKTISKVLKDRGPWSNPHLGNVRTQVQPSLGQDGKGMLEQGKTMASWGDNVMVKIPCTTAGIWTLEELAALGIPTNPTVCVSVSQYIAVGEAYENGIARAKKAGLTPGPSTAALVMGRLQDYLTKINTVRNAGLTNEDLELAALAVVKRCAQVNKERGFSQKIMPAAFRSARQIAQLAGADAVMTIHPKWQQAVADAFAKGEVKKEVLIDESVDQSVIDKVSKALPEFVLAYEPGALPVEEFDFFGATVMTLTGFDATGWQPLLTL